MLTEHQLRAQGFDSVSFREDGGGGCVIKKKIDVVFIVRGKDTPP